MLSTARQLGAAKSPLPAVLWTVDVAGVFTVLDGTGLPFAPGAAVGASYHDLYANEPDVLAVFAEAFAGPVAREVAHGLLRWKVTAAPLPGGGAVGMGVLLTPPVEQDDGAPCGAWVVTAPFWRWEKGDMLVFDGGHMVRVSLCQPFEASWILDPDAPLEPLPDAPASVPPPGPRSAGRPLLKAL